MNNNQKSTDINNPSKVYALFYSFFLIPLMITIFGVLFFFLFKMLTYEKQDPYHLLNNIKAGSLTKRWQSAYELSNLMRDPKKIPDDLELIAETMKDKGYLIRTTGSGLPAVLEGCIRITVGSPEQMKEFLTDFKSIVSNYKKS